MKSNNDRSKTIIQNYHARACWQTASSHNLQKKEDESHYLCINYFENMPYPTDWSIILVVLLKNCKIGIPLEMDFCCDSMALPEYILIASDRQVVNGVIG